MLTVPNRFTRPLTAGLIAGLLLCTPSAVFAEEMADIQGAYALDTDAAPPLLATEELTDGVFDGQNEEVTEEIGLVAMSQKSINSSDIICRLQESILTSNEANHIENYVVVSEQTDQQWVYKTLAINVDYKIDSVSLDNTNGTGAVLVRGIGEYEGETSLSFRLVKSIDLSQATVYYEDYRSHLGSVFVSGQQIKPKVESVDISLDNYSYSRRLTEKDYVVTYGENTNPGVGSVVVEPSGNGLCTGSHLETFSIINRTSFKLSDDRNSQYYSELAIDMENLGAGHSGPSLPQPIFPLRGGKVEPFAYISVYEKASEEYGSISSDLHLVEGQDYVLSYENNTKPGTARVVATGINGVSGSISCDFQIANGKIDIATLDLDAWDFEQAKYEYEGSPLEPKLRLHGVRSNRMKPPLMLEEGDYSLSYTNNNGVGTCTVTIRGTGSYYSGSVKVDIPIVSKGTLPVRDSLTECSVDSISPIKYDGQRKYPEIVLRDKQGNIVESWLYYVRYENNLNIGTAYAYVSGSWVKDSTGVPILTGATITVPFEIVDKETPEITFPDVSDSHWALGYVSRASVLGLFSGYSDGRFGPEDGVTRGQVATVLWRMAGKPAAGHSSFPDVEQGAYYDEPVSWAASVGITTGYSDGRFGPADPVTREQLATFIARYATSLGLNASGSPDAFAAMSDASEVSSWARPAFGWCFEQGIMSGRADGRADPQGGATRAQAAKMLVVLSDDVL